MITVGSCVNKQLLWYEPIVGVHILSQAMIKVMQATVTSGDFLCICNSCMMSQL